MNRAAVFQYVKAQYGTEPEYLWKKYPNYAVLRNQTGKWYGIVMDVPEKSLGISSKTDKIDVLVAKCQPEEVDILRQSVGFLPAYHMNKKSWITLILNHPVAQKQVPSLLAESMQLTTP